MKFISREGTIIKSMMGPWLSIFIGLTKMTHATWTHIHEVVESISLQTLAQSSGFILP